MIERMERNLRTIFFIMILAYTPTVYGQMSDTTQREYLIHTTKVNFHFGEQNYPFTLFIERDGHFYFNESFDTGEPGGRGIFESKKKHGIRTATLYKDVFRPTTDSIMTVESLFPKFITHDSSFINEYKFDYQLMPLINELIYSFLLHNLQEPSLYNTENKKAIRVIMHEGGIKHPGRYSTYRLEFENGKTILTYKEGDFDSSGTFKLLRSSECLLKEKDRLRVDKVINKIDFQKEYYFMKANLDPKFFIEYRNGKDYYAIKRPKDRGDYIEIYLVLYHIQARNARNNSR